MHSSAARSDAFRISLQGRLDRRILRQVQLCEARIAEDRCQQVVEVVGDSPGQHAQAFQLLGLEDLSLRGQSHGLHLLLARDVARDGRMRRRLPVVVALEDDKLRDRDFAAVRVAHRVLADPATVLEDRRNGLLHDDLRGPLRVRVVDSQIARGRRVRDAEQAPVRRVEVDNAVLEVGRGNEVRRRLYNVEEAVLFRLPLLAVREVEMGAGDAEGSSVLSPLDHRAAGMNPLPSSLARPHPVVRLVVGAPAGEMVVEKGADPRALVGVNALVPPGPVGRNLPEA